MQKNKVVVLTTGGTIEKTYNEQDGSLRNRRSHIEKSLLTKLRLPYWDLVIQEVMAKDSLEMNDKDRQLIFNQIKEALKYKAPILVLHGTDTMEVSASYCFHSFQEEAQSLSVPVIFTGAMKPVGFEDSDALQNFTEALVLGQVLEPGFYISFHSQVFKVPGVRKNKEKRTFEKVE